MNHTRKLYILFICCGIIYIQAFEAKNRINIDRKQQNEKMTLRRSVVWFTKNTEIVYAQKPSTGIKRLVKKVLKGDSLTMFILGGSNSAGAGLRAPNLTYFDKLTELWNKNFYQWTGAKLNIKKAAIGGCGSDFYSMCFRNFLPQTFPDIALIEEAVNDNGDQYGKAAQPMEILTRSLLLLPSHPLVMYVNLVNPYIVNGDIGNADCDNMQNLGFDELAKHYGIASFSMKDFACRKTGNGKHRISKENLDMYSKDGLHAGPKAHAKLASSIMDYFEKAISYANSDNESTILSEQPFSLFKPIFSNPAIKDEQLIDAKCWTTLTPDWNASKEDTPTLTTHVTVSRGFRYVSPRESQTEAKLRHRSKWHRDAPKAGWESKLTNETNIIKVSFSFRSLITSSSKNRSVIAIMRMSNLPGIFQLSINDAQKSCIKVEHQETKRSWKGTRLYPIAGNITPGNYTLTLESRDADVMIAGIAVGYQGYRLYEGYHRINETIANC